MRRFLLCSVLVFLAGFAAPMRAYGSDEEPLQFGIGHDPTGYAIDLPAWAFGNLTITGFTQRPILDVQVNILPELLQNPPEAYSLEPGEMVIVPLKSGARLAFYYKVTPTKVQRIEENEGGGSKNYYVDAYDVTLVVRKVPTH